MSKRLIVLLAGVLVVAAVAAGCGSSADSTTGDGTSSGETTAGGDVTTSELTKAEFIKKGDAICESANGTIANEANEFAEENDINTKKPTQKQQEEVIVAVVAPGDRAQGEEIADLGAPSGDEEEVEAIVVAIEEGAEELEGDPGLLPAGKNPLSKASKLAKSYGFKVCGE